MMNYKLIPYLIKVRKVTSSRERSDDEYYNLDDIEGIDLLNCIVQHLKGLKPATRVATLPELYETLTVSFLDSDPINRTIHGTIQCGEYGLELDAFDMETGEFIESFRKVNIAELIPHFFVFHLNKKYKKYGLLILQTFRNYGIKSIFSHFFREFVPNCITNIPKNGIEFEMNPILKKDVVKKLNEGRILQFRLIRYSLPKDCGSKYMINDPHEVVEERVFKVKRAKSLKLRMNDFKALLKNLQTDFYTLDGTNYDEIKFIIENQNRKRETFSTTKKEVRIKEFKEIIFPGNDFKEGETEEDYLLRVSMEYIDSLNRRGYYA